MFLDGALCLSHISLLGSDLILHQWESLERDGVRCQTLGESEPHLRWIYRYTSSNHPSFVLSNATTSAKKQKQITLLLYTFIGCSCQNPPNSHVCVTETSSNSTHQARPKVQRHQFCSFWIGNVTDRGLCPKKTTCLDLSISCFAMTNLCSPPMSHQKLCKLIFFSSSHCDWNPKMFGPQTSCWSYCGGHRLKPTWNGPCPPWPTSTVTDVDRDQYSPMCSTWNREQLTSDEQVEKLQDETMVGVFHLGFHFGGTQPPALIEFWWCRLWWGKNLFCFWGFRTGILR